MLKQVTIIDEPNPGGWTKTMPCASLVNAKASTYYTAWIEMSTIIGRYTKRPRNTGPNITATGRVQCHHHMYSTDWMAIFVFELSPCIILLLEGDRVKNTIPRRTHFFPFNMAFIKYFFIKVRIICSDDLCANRRPSFLRMSLLMCYMHKIHTRKHNI